MLPVCEVHGPNKPITKALRSPSSCPQLPGTWCRAPGRANAPVSLCGTLASGALATIDAVLDVEVTERAHVRGTPIYLHVGTCTQYAHICFVICSDTNGIHHCASVCPSTLLPTYSSAYLLFLFSPALPLLSYKHACMLLRSTMHACVMCLFTSSAGMPTDKHTSESMSGLWLPTCLCTGEKDSRPKPFVAVLCCMLHHPRHEGLSPE